MVQETVGIETRLTVVYNCMSLALTRRTLCQDLFDFEGMNHVINLLSFDLLKQSNCLVFSVSKVVSYLYV